MYKGTIIADWDAIAADGGIDNPEVSRRVRGALNHFLLEPTTAPFRVAAQAFANTGDTLMAKTALEQAFRQTQAFATSEDSALVGLGFLIIESNI